MGKLKNLFSSAATLVKEVFEKFPFTMIVVYAVTALFVFGTEEFIDMLYDSGWLVAIALSAMGIFAVENWIKEEQYLGFVATILIAIGFRYGFNMNLGDSVEEWLNKIFITYVATLSLLTIYKIIKNNEVSVEEYFLKAIANWGRITFIYILAIIGMWMVIGAFVTLILDGEDFEFFERLFIILFGCFYVPSLIHSATDMTQEHGKIIKTLILYVSTPVTTFLLAIFYMYLVKVSLTGTLFDMELFMILSWVYTIGMPVAMLLKCYDKTGKVKKFSKFLKIAFIPVIILQIITMSMRVNQYGLTSERYMGYILVLFEICLTTLSLYKDGRHLDKIFLIVIGFAFVFILSPINYIDIPVKAQITRLDKMLEGGFENLSEEDKVQAKKTYVYVLRDDDNAETLIKETIGEENAYKLENYTYDESLYDSYNNYGDIEEGPETEYIYADASIDGLDITEYKKIYKIYRTYSDETEDLTNIEVKTKDKEIIVNVDLTKFVKELIKADYRYDADEYLQESGIVKTKTDGIDLFLENVNLDYELYTERVTDVDFDGYILVK